MTGADPRPSPISGYRAKFSTSIPAGSLAAPEAAHLENSTSETKNQLTESRFCEAPESAFRRLEKPLKIPFIQ